MPFQAVPLGMEAKLLMTQNGVKMVNVWNVKNTLPIVPADLAGVAAVVDAWVTSDYAGVSSSSLHYDEIIVTDKSVANGAQHIRIPATTNGGVGTAQAAGNAAVVASLRTAATGRNFRGRTYVAGLTASAMTDAQHITVPFAANVNTAFVNLLAALIAGGYKLCVLSRFLNNALRAVGLLTEIITVITDTKIDSQQRRTAN